MMKIAAFAALATIGSAMVMPAKVEMDDMIESALKRGGTEDVFFHLSKSCTDEAKAHKAALMEDTGALPVKKLLRVAIHDHLVAFTEQEHAPIMAACEDAGLQCTSFWITNTVFAKDAPVDFIKKVMAEKKMDIKKVNGNKEYSVIDNVEGASMDEKFEVVDTDSERRRTQIAEYGIVLTEAEVAQLAGFQGEGATVCSVDTGVRWTHEALIDTYRGDVENHDYNWYGPGSSNYPSEPTDGNGHGTHVTGTMAGLAPEGGTSPQVGMAPAAQWIGAAGCNPFGSCPTFDLTAALQFSGCPTRTCDPASPECDPTPDCTVAPDIVSNSWGGGRGSSAFWDVLGVLREEEIIVTFSMGNSGTGNGGCDTANSPGDSELVISVGASDSASALASFSSRGPGIDIPGVTRQQPFVDGPGVAVISSFAGSDTQYASASGTSMSCPHVSGYLALLLGADPTLTIADVESIITTSSETTLPPPAGPAQECEGVSYTETPNFFYGWGSIRVCQALTAIGMSC
jgi:subtilisin family serine protease